MNLNRRTFVKTAAVSASAAMLPGCTPAKKTADPIKPLKLGLMSYNLAKEWDIDTIIKKCTETGFEHIELRTTHAHGVEVTMSQAERAEVRKRFENAGLKISIARAFRCTFS